MAGGGASSAEYADVRADSTLSGRLQALLDGLVAGEPGVRTCLLLVDGPDFHWEGASGTAHADSGLPPLPVDQFVTDSVAKMLTASVATKLVEEGGPALEWIERLEAQE